MTEARGAAAQLFSHDPGHSERSFDALTAAALAYLALPSLVFFLGWLRLPWGLAACALLALAAYAAVRRADWRWRALPLPVATALAVATVGFAWAAFGGAGHFGYANTDWPVRDAVLGDLVYGAWPPSYGERDGDALILRTALGYFLPAAALAKVAGIGAADLALYVWTGLGAALFLLLLPLPPRLGPRLLLCLAVAVLFSGMDVLGHLSIDLVLSKPPRHLEWWAFAYQYSSHSTQLFWVPNHALPAWIGAALFYRHWQLDDFYPVAILLAALLPLWTPFAVVGLLPYFAYLALDRLRKGRSLRIAPVLAAPVAALLVLQFRYLTLGADTMSVGASIAHSYDHVAFVMRYAKFVFFEFGLLALVLLVSLRHSQGLLWLSCAVLLALPWMRFGPGNDLVMRGSIPALAILCILCVRALADAGSAPGTRGPALVLAGILAVGAATPVYEFWRTVATRRWDPQYQHTLLDLTKGRLPPHYIGRLDRADLKLLLRPPASVPPRDTRRPR